MKNFLEGAIREIYGELKGRFPENCSCERCEADIVTFALNHLPPRYTVEENPGRTLVSVDLQKEATRAAFAVTVLEAIRVVGASPRHGKEPRTGQ
ncbi:MAG TPA: late competence development ComFB family protein [Gemmatimonadaceae bacterium]|nr:late competence development ComFB family protein [Gemmatimonadaceae bacterium]